MRPGPALKMCKTSFHGVRAADRVSDTPRRRILMDVAKGHDPVLHSPPADPAKAFHPRCEPGPRQQVMQSPVGLVVFLNTREERRVGNA